MSDRPRIALVCTVLDEAGTIDDLLRTIDSQTRSPDEIVFVDGGSRDGTVEALRRWSARREHVRVLDHPGANISAGRNAAIAATGGDVIAVTDGGCLLEPDWLERLAAPFEDPDVDVAMGFYVPEATSAFERIASCLNLPDPAEVDPQTFMPSSRSVAFRRRALDAVGGYPEWLDIGEDMWVNHRMREAGMRRVFVPDAVVRWRLRPDLRGFVRQYYRYAWGDGVSGMYPQRHALRFGAYALAAVLLRVAVRRPGLLVLPAAGAGIWLAPVYRRAWRRLSPRERALSVPAVPLLTVLMDASKMAGWLAGRLERRRLR